MLLHATVPEGTAVRGAYTQALAQELTKAKGQVDINEVHTMAVKSMRASQDKERNQVPMMQHTLEKFLILPWNDANAVSS